MFSQQISQIEDRRVLLILRKRLKMQRTCITSFACTVTLIMLEKVDFKKLNQLYNETARHLELLNLKESVQNNVRTQPTC
jgi:type I restriction enzyme R subunit